jgi:hypothetical protein
MFDIRLPGRSIMFYTWWKGDTIPRLPNIPRISTCFHVLNISDIPLLSRIMQLNSAELHSRLESGNSAYVAYINDIPAAYGWSAASSASIGEINLNFHLSTEDRYLWDFVTFTEWRGFGIYPRLLQAIMMYEPDKRLWIGHLDHNSPSCKGIIKAGLQLVGSISQREGTCHFNSSLINDRARIAKELLGL